MAKRKTTKPKKKISSGTSSTHSSRRPAIPEPMKREVRQRCGFGCVICGVPLYTYEHMLGYAKVRRHRADELTLLCDQHQRERTSGLLPIEQVRHANENPYNIREKTSTPYKLHYEGPECTADIGSNLFFFQDEGSGMRHIALAIDDDPLLAFKFDRGNVLISLNVYNKNDDLLLYITDNELTYSTIPWDINFISKNLVIRDVSGSILIDLLFEPPSRITIQRGFFIHKGIEIAVAQDHLEILNNHDIFSRVGFRGLNGILVGNKVKQRPTLWGFWIPAIPRAGTN